MPNRPVICGKCGTSSDTVAPKVTTAFVGGDIMSALGHVEVSCQRVGCGHSVSSDSLPAALLKPVTMRATDGGVRK
jgi:hypothetical protein